MVLKKNKQLLSNLGGIEYKIIEGKIEGKITHLL